MAKHTWLYILPFIVINVFIIFASFFKSISVSLGYFPLIGMRKVSFEYYQEILTSHYFRSSIVYSLYLALAVTLLSLITGLMMAYILLNQERKHWILTRIFAIPISLPHIIVALAAFQLLAQSGLISRLAYQAGLIHQVNQFPLFIHDSWGVGMIFVFLYKEIPYVAVTTLALLRQSKESYLEVARNLGASKIQSFFRISLPLLQTTLTTLFIILFCFTFSSFEVPYILGSSSHETIAVTIYNLFTQANLQTRPEAYALNVLISVLCLLVTLFALLLSRVLPGGRGTIKDE